MLKLLKLVLFSSMKMMLGWCGVGVLLVVLVLRVSSSVGRVRRWWVGFMCGDYLYWLELCLL